MEPCTRRPATANTDPAANRYANAVIALTPKELKLKDWYAPTNAEWLYKRDLDMNVTPVVFPYKGRELLVGSGKEGRFFLLDSQSLGGTDHRTPLFRSDLISNEDIDFAGAGTWGSLSTWEDAQGTRWVLAPVWGPKHPSATFAMNNGDANVGSIAAFKVEEKGGKPVLTNAWISRNLMTPAAPAVGQRRRLRPRERRVGAPGERSRRRPVSGGCPRAAIAAGDPVRARRGHRQGTVVERQPGDVVHPQRRSCRSRTAASTSRPTTTRCTASVFRWNTDSCLSAPFCISCFRVFVAGLQSRPRRRRLSSACATSPAASPTGMIRIPGGTFHMGCADCGMPDAEPVHLVAVDPFWMDETPVTNKQFAAFVAATGYVTIAERIPDAKDYPGVPVDKLVPGSACFRPPGRPGAARQPERVVGVSAGCQLEAARGTRQQRRRARTIIPSSTSRGTMRRRMRRGPASDCRPKPNTSSPPAAARTEDISPGATT